MESSLFLSCARKNQAIRQALLRRNERDDLRLDDRRRYTWSPDDPRAYCFRIWFRKDIGISISNSPISTSYFVETALVQGNETRFDLLYEEAVGYEDICVFSSIDELVDHLVSLFRHPHFSSRDDDNKTSSIPPP